MDEGSGLENRQGLRGPRGFESHLLRHFFMSLPDAGFPSLHRKQSSVAALGFLRQNLSAHREDDEDHPRYQQTLVSPECAALI